MQKYAIPAIRYYSCIIGRVRYFLTDGLLVLPVPGRSSYLVLLQFQSHDYLVLILIRLVGGCATVSSPGPFLTNSSIFIIRVVVLSFGLRLIS